MEPHSGRMLIEVLSAIAIAVSACAVGQQWGQRYGVSVGIIGLAIYLAIVSR